MKNNYHTHTTRCKHAQGTDETYVKAAIAAGFTTLGFSDHGPLPYTDGYSSPVRMEIDEMPSYFQSLMALKEKYADHIDIQIGFEYEYLPKYIGFIESMYRLPEVAYLILGNHNDADDRTGIYFGNCVTPKELIRYADSTVAGMKTGLFASLAHPDLFLMSYPAFDEAAAEASYMICHEAKKLNLPLEYNLYGVEKIENGVPGLGYPCPFFWEIAAQAGCTAIIGFDAHRPDMLENERRYTEALRYVRQLGLALTDTLPMKPR